MGMNEMLKALKGLPAEVKRLLDENGQLVDEVDRLNSELLLDEKRYRSNWNKIFHSLKVIHLLFDVFL